MPIGILTGSFLRVRPIIQRRSSSLTRIDTPKRGQGMQSGSRRAPTS